MPRKQDCRNQAGQLPCVSMNASTSKCWRSVQMLSSDVAPAEVDRGRQQGQAADGSGSSAVESADMRAAHAVAEQVKVLDAAFAQDMLDRPA